MKFNGIACFVADLYATTHELANQASSGLTSAIGACPLHYNVSSIRICKMVAFRQVHHRKTCVLAWCMLAMIHMPCICYNCVLQGWMLKSSGRHGSSLPMLFLSYVGTTWPSMATGLRQCHWCWQTTRLPKLFADIGSWHCVGDDHSLY